jgi:hypothetical protein
MNPKNRKCSIPGCDNDLKGGALKYCSIKCCHVAQKKSCSTCLNGCGNDASLHRNTYCSIACAHGHRYKCRAEMFFAQGGVCGYVESHFLARLLRDYYGERCLRCGWSKRHPKIGKVPVEVEHIDGDWQNSRLTNLTLLCPNCHALTPTFRGLNRGRGRAHRLNPRTKPAKVFESRAQPERTSVVQKVLTAPSVQLELLKADVAQLVEREPCKFDVAGSTPAVGSIS